METRLIDINAQGQRQVIISQSSVLAVIILQTKSKSEYFVNQQEAQIEWPVYSECMH